MTAIEKYIRLEAVGQWKETPDSDGREVIVSFGDATLVLSDMKENPLSHWALAGMQRMSLTGAKAVYTPDTQGFETLEIDDANMVEAIAQVSRLTVNQAPKRRGYGLWVGLFMLLAGLAAVAPLAIRYQARAMTGSDSQRYLGYQMIEAVRVSQCTNSEGVRARDLLMSRVFEDDSHRLIITDMDLQPKQFPGGIFLLSRAGLQSLLTPEDLAKWLEDNSNNEDHELDQMFRQAPLKVLVKYMFSGELPDDLIRQTGLSLMVYDETTPLINWNELRDPPLLRDQEWQALRSICLN